MSLGHIDISQALRRVAGRWTDEAMRQENFDGFPGKGKPPALEPMPAKENARLTWWLLRLLRQNDVIPDEVRLRKTIDRRAAAATADEVTRAVGDVNAAACNLNTTGTTAVPIVCPPVSPEPELDRLYRRMS